MQRRRPGNAQVQDPGVRIGALGEQAFELCGIALVRAAEDPEDVGVAQARDEQPGAPAVALRALAIALRAPARDRQVGRAREAQQAFGEQAPEQQGQEDAREPREPGSERARHARSLARLAPGPWPGRSRARRRLFRPTSRPSVIQSRLSDDHRLARTMPRLHACARCSAQRTPRGLRRGGFRGAGFRGLPADRALGGRRDRARSRGAGAGEARARARAAPLDRQEGPGDLLRRLRGVAGLGAAVAGARRRRHRRSDRGARRRPRAGGRERGASVDRCAPPLPLRGGTRARWRVQGDHGLRGRDGVRAPAARGRAFPAALRRGDRFGRGPLPDRELERGAARGLDPRPATLRRGGRAAGSRSCSGPAERRASDGSCRRIAPWPPRRAPARVRAWSSPTPRLPTCAPGVPAASSGWTSPIPMAGAPRRRSLSTRSRASRSGAP